MKKGNAQMPRPFTSRFILFELVLLFYLPGYVKQKERSNKFKYLPKMCQFYRGSRPISFSIKNLLLKNSQKSLEALTMESFPILQHSTLIEMDSFASAFLGIL